MRIAFIHPYLYRFARGIERFLFNLANTLAQLGADVEILTWRWPKAIVIDTLDPRVRVRILPTSRYYAAWFIIPFYTYRLIREGYDFVWIFFAGYGEAEAIALASFVRDVPYGVILHYPYAEVPHRYRELRRFGCVREARRIVSVSRFVADGVREAFGLESTIITSAVDVSRFCRKPEDRDRARQSLGLTSNDCVVVTAAALEPRKGIQHVLSALPAVRTSNPRVKYLVVGEGPYRPDLEQRVRLLGLENVARLIGATPDVLPYYRAADVFALLSHGEASPLAPLEAMAMELPLVVARQRPFDEVVTEGCGVMVAEEDSDEVARAIGSFLTDRAKALAAGRAGRERVCKYFSWKRIAEQYLQCSQAAPSGQQVVPQINHTP
jgi:glycosyltransferase involved in cell wall biosynthesis